MKALTPNRKKFVERTLDCWDAGSDLEDFCKGSRQGNCIMEGAGGGFLDGLDFQIVDKAVCFLFLK